MSARLVLISMFSLMFTLRAGQSYESASAEANRIEVTPIFDTLIWSDVADIIKEYENGMNPLEVLFNSASESEENIEDLLTEYQHYLDRAHKQRMNYLEKTKTKNKIPLTRHDRFAKTKLAGGVKYDDYYYPSSYKMPQTIYNSPLDMFVPLTSKFRYLGKTDLTTTQPKDYRDEFPTYEKKIIELPPVMPRTRYEPMKSSCYCKSGQIPCDCKCKQCLVPIDSAPQNYYQHTKLLSNEGENKGYLQKMEYNEDRAHDTNDNNINIRIKVDIQLPKPQDVIGKLFKNRSREEYSSKESSLNVALPYFNFPIPMDMFGYTKSQKSNSHDLSHKISIHKKKKSRVSNGNKKHRKKVITFHNLNIQPPQHKIQPYFIDNLNSTDNTEKKTERQNHTFSNYTIVTTQKPEYLKNSVIIANNTNENVVINNETQTEEGIYVMVNISNSGDNGTEDVHKIENSVETEYTKSESTVPTEKLLLLRRKRDISTKTASNSSSILPVPSNLRNKLDLVKNDTILTKALQTNNDETKKTDKALLADTELLYWPNNDKNWTNLPAKKNITTIILERENKKAKLNMSKETIRNDRTRVLEKAIFGDANWDDVDTVAPVFLSFVGKYLRGVLTFCSQNICHSMKCEEKTCVHRVCMPSDRWNQRGHCAGSNISDSVASLESIMDLPSNVAFEIVDILQDRILGKLFGKMTLCITTKCISFVAVKKNFLKSKCSTKALKMGHCPNIKNFKIL